MPLSYCEFVKVFPGGCAVYYRSEPRKTGCVKARRYEFYLPRLRSGVAPTAAMLSRLLCLTQNFDNLLNIYQSLCLPAL